jgi:hypothetical protein
MRSFLNDSEISQTFPSYIRFVPLPADLCILYCFQTQRDIHNLSDWCCHLVNTNFRSTGYHHPRNISLSASTHRSQSFCHFLNASWKSWSVREFSTACDSASINSIVSKRRPFNFIFNRGTEKVGWEGGDIHVVFDQISLGKRTCERIRCRVATGSTSVVKVRREVFTHLHAVSVKCHSSMRN